MTERKRPEPLFVAAIIGINQLKRVNFDPGSSPLTFIDQGLKGLRKKLERWKGQIPCFGKPTGVIINFSPDESVRFDLDGQPVEMLDGAYRLGQTSLPVSTWNRDSIMRVYGGYGRGRSWIDCCSVSVE